MAPSIPTSTDRYSGTAIALHWLVAVLIVVAFWMGWSMVDLPFSPRRLKLFNWHKWVGMVAFGFIVLRLVWRMVRKPPPELPLPAWQQHVAHAMHLALYLLMIAVPLVGWAYTSATGFPVVLFGVLPLPDFVPVSKPLATVLREWHEWLSWAMAALVVLHMAAALKHHFVDRDTTMVRMWWSRRRA